MAEPSQVEEPALNEPAVEDNSQQADSPASEPTTSAEPATEGAAEQAPTDEPAAEATEVEAESAAKPDLTDKQIPYGRFKQVLEENKQLKSQIGQPVPTTPQAANGQSFSQMLQGRETVDPSELDQLAEQFAGQKAQAMVDIKVGNLEQKIVQEKAYDALVNESKQVEQEPEFDPKSDSYVPGLEEKVAQAYEARAVRLLPNPYDQTKPIRMLDPNVSFQKIANEYIEVARAAADRGRSTAVSSRESLADTASVTPTPETTSKSADSTDALKDSLADIKF